MRSGMASGFSDFCTGGSAGTTNNTNGGLSSYRTQLSQMMFLPPTPQISQQRLIPSLIGKRTLAEFQAHHRQLQQQQQQQQQQQNMLLRSVKPRIYQQSSPISTLTSIEPNFSPDSSSSPALHRYSVPRAQQLRPRVVNWSQAGPPDVQTHDMMNRLLELERQLLDDDNDAELASVITNSSSEWCQTNIQSLIASPPSPCTAGSCKETLLEAALNISEGKTCAAEEILRRVSRGSGNKSSCEERLMVYMASALKSRVHGLDSRPPVCELYGREHMEASNLLYELSPCFKLGFIAANLAILEATLDESNAGNRIHVVDFGVGHGGQYINLLHAVSSRMSHAPASIQITAVGEETERLKMIGDMLRKISEMVEVSLCFDTVNCKTSDLTREALRCDPETPLAVNFAFRLSRLADESVTTENPRDEMLRRVKRLGPRVVTLVEQEMNTNTAPLTARVNETCAYYSALFDSIETTVTENQNVARVEDLLGRKLVNSVACEGRDRVERCEVFGKWKARMKMAGFELLPPGPTVVNSLKQRLCSSNRLCPGFTVAERDGGVCFGWMAKTLTVASAWH